MTFTSLPPAGEAPGDARRNRVLESTPDLPERKLRALNGAIFEPAVQPISWWQGPLYGDAGDGEHSISGNGGGIHNRYPQDAGQRLSADNAGAVAFTAFGHPRWGMSDAATEYRSRYLVALDLPSIARPHFAPRSLAMRPSAEALPVRLSGEPPGVQTRRTVAPGKVTRWEQSSIVWPQFGGG
jgi:hypothetical protein